jgi:hypothetical protein
VVWRIRKPSQLALLAYPQPRVAEHALNDLGARDMSALRHSRRFEDQPITSGLPR